jgi:hypothetical protein
LLCVGRPEGPRVQDFDVAVFKMTAMKKQCLLSGVIVILAMSLVAQQGPGSGSVTAAKEDFSGMYSFLREGEFVQIPIR